VANVGKERAGVSAGAEAEARGEGAASAGAGAMGTNTSSAEGEDDATCASPIAASIGISSADGETGAAICISPSLVRSTVS
jgi:hypothetical protein